MHPLNAHFHAIMASGPHVAKPPFRVSPVLSAPKSHSETGIGGVKTYRTVEGGELAPKAAPRRLGLWAPKLAIFYRISVERGQFQGPLKIQNFHPPPLTFGGELTPLSRSPTHEGLRTDFEPALENCKEEWCWHHAPVASGTSFWGGVAGGVSTLFRTSRSAPNRLKEAPS